MRPACRLRPRARLGPTASFVEVSQEDDRKSVEAGEVAILGEETRGTVLEANGCDLGVEDVIARGAGGLEYLTQQSGVAWARAQQTDGWARQQGLDRVHCFGHGRRWIENSRMRYHAQELTDAEHRDGPRRLPLGEAPQRAESLIVTRQLLPIGVQEDVGVDRDQERPSIASNNESRSVMSTPPTSLPRCVFHFSR